jgi:hypothetical protein
MFDATSAACGGGLRMPLGIGHKAGSRYRRPSHVLRRNLCQKPEAGDENAFRLLSIF